MSKQQQNDPTTGVDSLGKALRRNLSLGRIITLGKRGLTTVTHNGFEAAGREFIFRVRLAMHRDVWRYRADIPLRKDLRAQRKAVFSKMPKISVVVPLYNTPLPFLHHMVKSVQKQSYPNWELMLVDASDKKHNEVARIADKYAQKDTRIKISRVFRNTGISGNTNVGFAESKGSYLLLLDHDDALSPSALYEVVCAINETGADLIYSDEVVLDGTMQHLNEFHFKPDYAPDTLRGCNYITHICAFSRMLLKKVGGKENQEFDGAQDYDLILRMTEQAEKIHHIPKVLYYWRGHESSTASDIEQKPYALLAGEKALEQHLQRVDIPGKVEAQKKHPGSYRVDYEIFGSPRISVLIPSKDHIDDLQRCLESLYKYAGWHNFEVLVLENNSTDIATEAYYQQAEEIFANLQVLRYSGDFNFAAICNFGAKRAKGDHLLFLNNDMEILEDGFLAQMLFYSQRPDVGAVGAMLYYPDDTVQHAGLIIGIGGTAGVSHKGHKRGDGGDMFRLCTTQNVSAVTGAALMVKKRVYAQLEGMDEQNFAVAFNDVDFCLRLREIGLWNVFTPYAVAYHYESKSRGYDNEGPAKIRFDKEAEAFKKRHATILEKGDPFYNPHFTLKFENFGLS